MSPHSPLQPTTPLTAQSNPLSRTSSVASISSDDFRRTRNRFTSTQLVMLDQLFYHTSHPTREEREAVAQAAGLEMKSVTIWFQNKRQTERKVALHYATSQSNIGGHRLALLPERRVPASPAVATVSASASASVASLYTSRSPHVTPRRKTTPPRPRPSLDRVAARSESRLPPPRTPTKPRDPLASLWDNMPSSPLAPPASPPARDFVDFLGNGRTLEWACAAARLADKEGRQEKASKRACHDRADGDVGDDTEDEVFEAITPEDSSGSADVAWREEKSFHGRLQAAARKPNLPRLGAQVATSTGKEVVQDDDTMRAALALCGLGRRL